LSKTYFQNQNHIWNQCIQMCLKMNFTNFDILNNHAIKFQLPIGHFFELMNVGMWLLHNHVTYNNMCILDTLKDQFGSWKLTILGVATLLTSLSIEHIAPIESHKIILNFHIVFVHITTTQWNRHWEWWGSFKNVFMNKNLSAHNK